MEKKKQKTRKMYYRKNETADFLNVILKVIATLDI